MQYLKQTILLLTPLVGIIYLSDLPSYFGFSIGQENYIGLFLALIMACVYLDLSITKRPGEQILNKVMAIISLLCGGFVALSFPSIFSTLGQIRAERVILGAITILLVLEATRRLKGSVLMWVCLIFILYSRYAYLLPGMLYTREISWSRLISYLYLDPNSILGVPLVVSATIILSFLFFGQCLLKLGGGEAFTKLAYASMGKYRGGPAKVSIVGSAMFGTMSGSAVSDVTTIGVITIPMMKKFGFSPNVAAAIESVAGTGGVITPPVLGVVAFIMAEMLQKPYGEIALAATIPAFIFYLYLLTYIDMYAARLGLKGIPKEELPPLWGAVKSGSVFLFPVFLLIYLLLIKKLNPSLCALYASASVLAIGLINKKLTWRSLNEILVDTARAVYTVAIFCAAAGIIMGVISVTGLGTKVSQILIQISGPHSYLLLGLTAATCILLGMGIPITPSYLLLVLLIAPALTEMGLSPLNAHFFIFYFSATSFITPPVCVAVYAAASIANSDIMKTGWTAMKIGVPFYLLPFLFSHDSTLLFHGEILHIIFVTIKVCLGFVAIACGMAGHFLSRLGYLERTLLVVGGIGLCLSLYGSEFLGIVLIVIPLFTQLITKMRLKRVAKAVND
jgi:TRAP transporter 4TM/12TM fusion protein